MLKIAYIANEPPPYRIPIFNQVARATGVHFRVIFCCRREPNRHWNLPPIEFEHEFLNENIRTVNGRYIHNNPGVIKALYRFRPDIVLTNGFNPTHLYAFLYAAASGAAFIPMTDGTQESEGKLTFVHRMVRRLVYLRSHAYIAASHGSHRLYDSYGIPAARRFSSCLCIDNEAYAPRDLERKKEYDFIFCGRYEAVKNPLFALELAQRLAPRLGRRTRILFVGSGSLEEQMRTSAAAKAAQVDTVFHGFARQEELPALYQSAAIFLFPTTYDPWGIVANEACAAGLPVLVTPQAGCAGEIVVDNENGFVCPLSLQEWVERAHALLTDQQLYRRHALRSLALIRDHTFDHAAAGILAACRHAAMRKGYPAAADLANTN